MPLHHEYILTWVRLQRPDLADNVAKILDSAVTDQIGQAFLLMLSVGFEAGRQFQHDLPDAPLNDPSSYISD